MLTKFRFLRQTLRNFSSVNLSFKYLADGSIKTVTVEEGTHLLKAAHDNEIDLEGSCEASLACSTCHVILPSDIYDKLPEPEEEEDDLLNLAFGLTHTSRLGCQVKVTKEFEGAVVSIPTATRNFYVDGHKPKPH